MKELALKPIHNWQLKDCRVKIDDADTIAWAQFIIDNLTTKNKDSLKGMLTMTVKCFGWLSEDAAMMFGSVIEDRTKALIKAIDSGKVPSYRYPSLSYQRERHILGATICELIAQGYESEFFSSFEEKQ
ncbi:hypothetical protein LMH73_018605 [Vibrio splendidus]|nr:hypothetical protein [Vibrio splendidus]MCC4882750.1 hypothetical protein [Vibrio splendidus]